MNMPPRLASIALFVGPTLAFSLHAQDVPRIPLRTGLTIVTAVHESSGPAR